MAMEVNIVELEIQLQENFTKKLGDIEKALDPVQKKLDSMKTHILTLTEGLRDMIKAFKLVSGNTANFKKRVTQLNTEMKELKKSSTDMSASIKKSTTVGISQFNKLQKEVTSLKVDTDNSTKSMSNFNKTMKGLQLGAIGYAGFGIGKSLLTQASDAQEASNLFNVIFDNMDANMKQQSEDFRTKYGLSTSTYAQEIAELGAAYKNMGLNSKDAFEAAQKAMVDALDISSGFNKSIGDSILKVKSGISGETEPLKGLGIIVTVDAMNAYAASIGKSYANMNQLERALLRTQKITADLKKSNISGDFLRTSDEYAVSLSRVKELWISIKEELGNEILPLVTDILASILRNKDALSETASSLGAILGSIAKFFIENSSFLKTLLTIFITAKAVGAIKFAITMSKGVMAAVETLGALMGISATVVGAGLVLTVGAGVAINQAVKASIKEKKGVLKGEMPKEVSDMYLQAWKDERKEMYAFMNDNDLSIQTMSKGAKKRLKELDDKIAQVNATVNKSNKSHSSYEAKALDEFKRMQNRGLPSYALAAMNQSKNLKVKEVDNSIGISSVLQPLIDSMKKDLSILTKTGASNIEKYKSEITSQKKILEKAMDEGLKDEADSAATRIKYLMARIKVAKKEEKAKSDSLASIEKYKKSSEAFKQSFKAIDIKANIFGDTKLDAMRDKMEGVKSRIITLLGNENKSLVKSELELLTNDLKGLKQKVKLGDERKTLIDRGKTLSDNLNDITTMAVDFGVADKDTNRSKADAYREYLVGIAENGITQLERSDFDLNAKRYTEVLGDVVSKALSDIDPDSFDSLTKDNKGLNLEELETSLADVNKIIEAIKGSTGDIKLLPEDIQKQLEEAKKVKIQVEDLIEPKKKLLDSAKKFKSTMDSIAGVFNQLAGATGNELLGNIGGLVSSIGGLGSIDFSSMNVSSMAGLSSIAGGAGAAVSAGVALRGLIDGLDSGEAERGEKELKEYKENTDALENLGKILEKNIDSIETLGTQLIKATSLIPTLGNISKGENIFSGIFKGIEESEKNLGKLSLSARYKKSGGLFSSTKRTTRTTSYSTEELLTMMGFDSNTASLTLDGLKNFRESLNSLTHGVLEKMSKGATPDAGISGTLRDLEDLNFKIMTSGLSDLGIGKTLFGGSSYEFKGFESNIATYKKNVEAMISTLEQLQIEESEFFRGSTMESFVGISYVAAKELRKEYETLFDGLGLNTKEYSSLIDDMVKQNQVLVTSMQDVRGSFINAFKTGGIELGTAFIQSMSSFFDKMKTNISQVLYDTLFSDVTDMGDKFFSDFSEGLLSAKKGEISITDAINNSLGANQGFFDELIDVSEMKGTMEDYWDVMRQTLVDSGLSKEIIDQLLPPTAQAIEWANRLVTAMNSAIDTNTFDSFSKSLGESLYNTVKDSLIQAFADSQAYQNLIGNFMEDVDFTGLSFEESFNLIESKMAEFNDQLRGEGLDFKAETGATTGVDVIATSNQVAQDTTGATITNNYKYYVIDIDGSYVGVDAIEKMKENFEADGFVRDTETKF